MQFERIVVCTDFSEDSEKALERALEIAKTNQASLDVVHVIEPIVNPLATAGIGGLAAEAVEATLEKVEAEMKKKFGFRIGSAVEHKIVVREGHPATEIVAYLKQVGADLVVTGASGLSGMGLVLFGSVSARIARKSPCDVLIVKRKKD